MHTQQGYFANNESLNYDFHGLTDDGRYYLKFCYPVSAPMLLDGPDPATNQNPNALALPPLPDDINELYDLMYPYNQEAARALEALPAANFQPDLALLDALVASLRVDPEE
jgi:hypothetical protein